MMILAGDIGGTQTRLALFVQSDSELRLLTAKKQASKDWRDLGDVLQKFLQEVRVSPEQIETGCLSFAGPIRNHHCRLTNLNRDVDLERVQRFVNSAGPLLFCNDLVALGYGALILQPSQLTCLTSGSGDESEVPTSSGNRAILAPGTGLGESFIVEGNVVCPTEGAHADFAPRTEQEIRLWRFLHHTFGHVSNERLLSGPGLTHLYRFVCSEAGEEDSDQPSLSPQTITANAMTKRCPHCEQAVELFITLLGAEAGNLALRTLAWGGIYLGGGIVPHLLPQLRTEAFLEAFRDKGRMRDMMTRIPVYVIHDEQTGLWGAARYALAHQP